ncbi:MAG: hypothetical protein AAGA99_19350 [Actinomycetota bacterium]
MPTGADGRQDEHSVWVRPPVPDHPMICDACDVVWEASVEATCWSCGGRGRPFEGDLRDGLVA